jgi:hypothetical protein
MQKHITYKRRCLECNVVESGVAYDVLVVTAVSRTPVRAPAGRVTVGARGEAASS